MFATPIGNTETKIDATRLGSKLYIGSRPPTGDALRKAGFRVLVLAAASWQPKGSVAYPGLTVIHAPLRDAPDVTEDEYATAQQAARIAARHVIAGRRTLIACEAGLNRSGFVAALTLHELTGWSGKTCADYVRAYRHGALFNTTFLKILSHIPAEKD